MQNYDLIQVLAEATPPTLAPSDFLKWGQAGICAFMATEVFYLYWNAMHSTDQNITSRGRMAGQYMIGCIILSLIALAGQWFLKQFEVDTMIRTTINRNHKEIPVVGVECDDNGVSLPEKPVFDSCVHFPVHNGAQFKINLDALTTALIDYKNKYDSERGKQADDAASGLPGLGLSTRKQ